MRNIILIFRLLSGGLISYGYSRMFSNTINFKYNNLQNTLFRLGITILLIFSLSNTHSQIQPAACSNTVIPVTAAIQNFYDPGGIGGNACVPDVANNYPNSGCITAYNFVSPVGTTILLDFSVLSLYNTVSGWDWMVVYDGGNNTSPILFDNRAGAPDNDGLPVNPNAGCFEVNNVLFCSTGNELFIEFFASGVISREGWEATVTLCNAPCSIINVTTNITTCNPGQNAYDVAGSIDFITPPAGGVLTITDCHGNNQIFNPPFVSPINYNLTGILSDGLPCDVTAVFSTDLLCTFTANYTAPAPDSPPTASDPLPMDVECFDDVLDPDATVVTDENDNGATPTVAWEDDTSVGNTCPETILRRYRVTDDCGNFIFVTQTITVEDITAPTFAGLPGATAVECIGDLPAMIDLTWNDNCDGTGVVSGSDASDGNTCPETITRTWTYTDACGNIATVSQIITVDDTIDPTATDPSPQVGLPPFFDPTQVTDATDNCGVPTITAGGDISDGGTCPEIITRTYIITDACGNFITVEQTFTVGDPVNPTATDPLPMNVECVADVLGPDATVVTDENDNGSTPIVTWEDDNSDGNTCPETILRRYRVTDDCGNFIFVTQIITVEDITAPTFSGLPGASSVECIGDVPAMIDLTWNDNCDGTGVVTGSDASDGNTCPEVITRTWTYTDACGNIATVSQLISVGDTQIPVFVPQPIDVAVQCSADVPVAADLAWNDNCDGTGMSVATDISDGLSCPETITRTWTYTDACGNNASVSQIITVEDTQAPLLALPLNAAVVSCTADIPAMVDLNYTDNCDAPGSVTGVDVSDGLSCPETITRTWTYTDACGNNATASQTIVVNDLINPTASNPTAISVPGSMDVPAPDVAVVTDEADNCTLNPIVTIEGADVSDGNVCNGEIITRTYRVTDDCGNFILVTQQITIEATYPPISIDDQVICEGSSTTLTAVNPMNVPISWDNGVQDGVSFTPTQTTLYTVTADNLGCISTASATVTLEEIPMVDFTADTLSGCEPLTVVFTNLSVAGASGSLEACIWDIEGASNSISGCGDVSYTFGSEGLYDVTLTTISSTGCSNTLTLFDYIYVEDLPVASFTLSDGVVSTLDTEVDFTNTSSGADNYQWTFGDGTIGSTDVDPSHIFPDIETNGYSVELIAYSQNGCSDTARLIVLVEEELIFYVPNTFTPDGDAFNNIFQPVFTSGFDPFDFNMLIFNRWGEVIFETNDASVGWNGTYLSGQGLVQDGTYTWRIEFKQTKNDKRLMKTGHVSILR